MEQASHNSCQCTQRRASARSSTCRAQSGNRNDVREGTYVMITYGDAASKAHPFHSISVIQVLDRISHIQFESVLSTWHMATFLFSIENALARQVPKVTAFLFHFEPLFARQRQSGSCVHLCGSADRQSSCRSRWWLWW